MKLNKHISWFLALGMAIQMSYAQRMIPTSFQYRSLDSVVAGMLVEVAAFQHPDTRSLRLYFGDITLNDGSYLVLEGKDGAVQHLDSLALVHWNHTSAYFNGNELRLSVYQASVKEVVVEVRSLGITSSRSRTVAKASRESAVSHVKTAAASKEGNPAHEYPFQAAVGRLTDGDQALMAGWIAPNGALVTSWHSYMKILEGFDVIEFNVPPSNEDGTIVHPGPEDQYLIDGLNAIDYSEWVDIKKYGRSGALADHWEETRPGYAIMDMLPNGTGNKPGVNQQEYFAIGVNPDNSLIKAQSIQADIFSYATLPLNYSLQRETYPLVKNNLRFRVSQPDKERFILYDISVSNTHPSDVFKLAAYFETYTGGPVTIHASRLAIGVHCQLVGDFAPSVGYGFKDNNFVDALDNFYTTEMIYVDGTSSPNAPNGQIHRPFVKVQDGADQATEGGMVSIAKGYYNESVLINKEITLDAPVGEVIIGMSSNQAAQVPDVRQRTQKAEHQQMASLSQPLGMAENIDVYPNPFKDQTHIEFLLEEEVTVEMKVFNMNGQLIYQTSSAATKGRHSIDWKGVDGNGVEVPAGMYHIQLHMGNRIANQKIVKK